MEDGIWRKEGRNKERKKRCVIFQTLESFSFPPVHLIHLNACFVKAMFRLSVWHCLLWVNLKSVRPPFGFALYFVGHLICSVPFMSFWFYYFFRLSFVSPPQHHLPHLSSFPLVSPPLHLSPSLPGTVTGKFLSRRQRGKLVSSMWCT